MAQKGYATPEGGWAGCAALFAACGLFAGIHEQYVARLDVETFRIRFASAEQLQLAMIEAWTRALVPPQLAASFFLLLGIHPAWALRFAGSVHTRVEDAFGVPLLPKLAHKRCHFHDPTTAALSRIMFDAIASVVEEIERRGTSDWALESLVCAVQPHLIHAAESVQALDDLVPRGQVKVCMPDVARASSMHEVEMWLTELLHQVFIPARVLTALEAETYCVHRPILGKVRVFDTPELHQFSA